MEVIKNDPLVPFTFTKMIAVGSMVMLTTYGLINFLKFFVKLRSTLNVRNFYCDSLKVTDLEIQTISWPIVVEKFVLLQKSQQLCVVKDLSEHDIFQSMFDSKTACIHGNCNAMLLLSPCLVIFPLVYLFLRHAEEFYNNPSTASSRRWSNLSRWILREYNEVEHLFKHRMNHSTAHSLNYLKQFPTPLVSIVAKFIPFVCGGLAGILLILGFLGESILEGHVFGRNLFWYTVVFGTIATVSRKVVADELQVIDPEGAMSFVVQQTHHMPKRWRGKENSEHVRREFETLFQFTITMLLEEMASIFITPYLLISVVPKRVDDILRFSLDFTVYVDGVGDVCSLSLFDFRRHGNRNYGSPLDAVKSMRSSQGKMEKSLLRCPSF